MGVGRLWVGLCHTAREEPERSDLQEQRELKPFQLNQRELECYCETCMNTETGCICFLHESVSHRVILIDQTDTSKS